MIEIVFSESTAGSMKLAKGTNGMIGGAVGFVFVTDDGHEPTPEEIERERVRVEEARRKMLGNTVPMEGSSHDVAWFPLNLSMGDISEPFSDRRAEYLQSLVLIAGEAYGNVGRELLDTARKSLERVCSATEPVRIWYSRNPDELCGFCHILTCLPENADIRVVELPWQEFRDGEIRTYSGWGDVDPMELGAFQRLERPLTAAERRHFTELWRVLQAENGPLRAVVGGKLRTVTADHYDELILKELYRQPEEFHEGRLIGEILGKYPIGIGDSLIALRVEEFISRGMLTPTTAPAEDRPIYHRNLRRVKTKFESDDWRLLSVDDDLLYRDINPTDGEEIGLHAPYLTHCAFCWTQVEHTRHQFWYIPTDLSCCICEKCYQDFREMFHWRALDGWDIEWNEEE